MTLEVMRDDLLMLIKNELQVDRCTLIGHSLGGRVAMVTALSRVCLSLRLNPDIFLYIQKKMSHLTQMYAKEKSSSLCLALV